MTACLERKHAKLLLPSKSILALQQAAGQLCGPLQQHVPVTTPDTRPTSTYTASTMSRCSSASIVSILPSVALDGTDAESFTSPRSAPDSCSNSSSSCSRCTSSACGIITLSPPSTPGASGAVSCVDCWRTIRPLSVWQRAVPQSPWAPPSCEAPCPGCCKRCSADLSPEWVAIPVGAGAPERALDGADAGVPVVACSGPPRRAIPIPSHCRARRQAPHSSQICRRCCATRAPGLQVV